MTSYKSPQSEAVELLVLGAGWTSQFLLPLLNEKRISFSATSRDGGDRSGIHTIKFQFDPLSEDEGPYTILPEAKTVLITFPLYSGSEKLVRLWKKTHDANDTGFIQLGSTGIWDVNSKSKSNSDGLVASTWSDRHSPIDTSNERACAENELLALSPETPTTVLNLCGLWGGARSMRNWVGKVAPTKEALEHKKSIHMIHGLDVARCILAVHQNFSKAVGQRWLITDERVYDWWDLASAWGSGGLDSKDSVPSGPHPTWVQELMQEKGVRALPRPPDALGRVLDSREFWTTFGLSPAKARLE